MADERVVQLLEEIRDLQRQHIANQQRAIDGQQASIRMQQDAMRRVRTLLIVAAVLAGLLLFVVGSAALRLVGHMG